MTLIRTLHPSGIYIDSYIREPGEYEALVRRSEQTNNTESRVPVVTVATELRKAMNAKGMMHKELAEAVGVSYTLVSKWLHGQSLPNAENLRKLCELLELEHLATRRLAGVDPVTIPSTANETYTGASDAGRAWNGGMYRERRVKDAA